MVIKYFFIYLSRLGSPDPVAPPTNLGILFFIRVFICCRKMVKSGEYFLYEKEKKKIIALAF